MFSFQLIYLNYCTKYIIWSRSFAAQPINSKHFHFLKILSLAKLLRPLSLLHTEASVLVLKMILSSAQILSHSSKAQRSNLALHFVLPSSTLTVSLLGAWLTIAPLSLSHNLWDQSAILLLDIPSHCSSHVLNTLLDLF